MTKLSAHMDMEESLVYPSVSTKVGSADEEEAEVEVGRAREGLDKLASMMEASGFGAAVEMLKGGISHHVEERKRKPRFFLNSKTPSLVKSGWPWGTPSPTRKQDTGLPVPQRPRRRRAEGNPQRPRRIAHGTARGLGADHRPHAPGHGSEAVTTTTGGVHGIEI
jgi:hypothetical protein